MKKLFFTLAMMLVGSTAAWADVYFKADPFYIEPGQEVEVPIYIYSEGEDLGTDEYGAYSVYCAFQTVFKLSNENLSFAYYLKDRTGTYYTSLGKNNSESSHTVATKLSDDGQSLKCVVYSTQNSFIFPIGNDDATTDNYFFKLKVVASSDATPGIYSFDIAETIFAKTGNASGVSEVGSVSPEDVNVKASIPANLDETVAYPYTEAFEKVDAKVNRTIKEGWNTVVYPFALTNDEVEAAFGEGTKVYNYTETTAGSVKFNSTTDGIAANVPVLVKATKAISAEEDLYFTDKAITSSEAGKVTGASYDFTGNYAGTIDIEAGNYLFSNGKLVKLTSGSTLKSYRAYLAANGASVKGLSIEIDDVPTGIELVNGEVETVGDIYTVGGQLVRRNSTVKGLPEGIYMINGNKVVVRK
ncbi:hypothetical protein [uncultured Methanobrevibacter sp.]|uniref:hypothetical protein n=1 Tax=uncultured Methanobrevibacter sp. TaxID=253161 RepID=UPI0025DC35AC|nr:hypothetical protein [uncultured Methanobrevibacter sp.]